MPEKATAPAELAAQKEREYKKSLVNLRREKPRATMKDLIERKMRKEADAQKRFDVYIPSMDATLPFQKPSEIRLFEFVDETDGKGTLEQMEATKRLIYDLCEPLQNPELHKELGILDPDQVVGALFEMSDYGAITDQMAELMGMEDFADTLKNVSGATLN